MGMAASNELGVLRSTHHAVWVAISLLSVSGAAAGTPSTSYGKISVAQIAELIEKAPVDTTSRKMLTAYLVAVGETAGLLIDQASDADGAMVSCQAQMTLSDTDARREILSAQAKDPVETAATPLILQDMLQRAGCRFVK